MRALAAAPLTSFAFVACMALVAYAMRSGFVSDDAVRLWAGASAAGDGQMPIGRIVAAYPTIPFLASVLISLLTPDGTPAPALLAAGLFGLLAGIWYLSFRDAGLTALTAVAVTVCVAFHPLMLRNAMQGPAELFLAIFLYLFGRGLYDLRANGTTSDVMTVGLALLGLAFSHPVGAAIAFASIPFLSFAVRPALAATSVVNVVVALVFPTVFAVGTFVYVSWVFPGSGWSFLTAPSESLSTWSAGVTRAFGDSATGSLAAHAAAVIAIALVLGAPVAPVALAWVRHRTPLLLPAVVFAAIMVSGAAIAVAAGAFGDPTAIAVAAPILCAILVTRIPAIRERLAIVLPLLALGWLGGLASVAIVDPAGVMQARAQWDGGNGSRDRLDALAAGGATIGRDGVLVDSDNAPAIVLGRGQARGLLDSRSEAFTLAMLFSRIDAPFVAVPNPQSVAGAQDRLNRAFPLLYGAGAPGYQLIYQNEGWRLFARKRRDEDAAPGVGKGGGEGGNGGTNAHSRR